MTEALKVFRCCSLQHEDKKQCWNIFYVEHQRGFLSVRKPRNHQDAAAGAATEGRCSLIIMAFRQQPTFSICVPQTKQPRDNDYNDDNNLFQYLKAWYDVVSH